MTRPARVVVAGAGLAGLRVVEELRAQGYEGELTLIGAESREPYDRPPLSKKVLAGELDDTSLRPDLEALGVRLRLGQRAVGLADHLLRTDSAEYAFGCPGTARSTCCALLTTRSPFASCSSRERG
jgi:3-phenylpropionate/trans-cinnamate dioxygenase ferredoxin reductase subunit